MNTRHVCVCMCIHCERTSSGAFGPGPDGSPGLVVVKPRRRRRRRRDRRSKRAA